MTLASALEEHDLSTAAPQDGEPRPSEAAGSSPASASPSTHTATVGHWSECSRRDGTPAAILTLWVDPSLLEQLSKGLEIGLVLPPASAPPGASLVALPAAGDASGHGAEADGISPEEVPEPEWAGAEAGDFRKALDRMGLDYQSVCDLCESRKMARPSRLGPELRAGVLRRLATPEGRAAYDAVRSKRLVLLEGARALTIAARARAAERAGLLETEPAKLSGLELQRLLSAAADSDSATNDNRCKSCNAPLVWVETTKGARMPCDPELLRVSPRGKGARATLVCIDGVTRTMSLDPEGPYEGYISHFSSCPHADQHRKSKEARP